MVSLGKVMESDTKTTAIPPHDVADLGLAELGRRRIAWARAHMPALEQVRKRFEASQPLRGLRVAACLHITTETANLLLTLAAGGAEVVACASNPLSTQDDVAASLVADHGISVFAVKGESSERYWSHIDAVLDFHPHLTMDDGCDLVSRLHAARPEHLKEVLAGTEETTTGVNRLRSMARDKALAYPVVAVNEARTKHLFDNRHGTGQSSLDGVIRATNLLLAGSCVVVVGYGNCGKGVAARARGLGAQVIVCEVDPIAALEAVMDGFRVEHSLRAAEEGDVFITVTGNRHVLGVEHFKVMKDGAVLANAGHFDIEIDVAGLRRLAGVERGLEVRPGVEELVIQGDGGPRRLWLLTEGRLVNLAAAEGHPAAVMDMSFCNQALVVEWLASGKASMEPGVHVVPEEIDSEVAALKLRAMGVEIDSLSAEQRRYLESWAQGT
jgi:adenosylhomocysteinase